MLEPFPGCSVQSSSPRPTSPREPLTNPIAGDPGERRKRRRGISPQQRVQRPRVSLDDGVTALNALTMEQQAEVEAQAAIGITGPNSIHR